VSQQIIVDREGKSSLYLSLSRALEEGRVAIVTDVGAGCGGRKDAIDDQRLSGRQSRVVLTPQWQVRQVRKEFRLLGSDGDKQALVSPGRARNKLLKPLRREGRTASAEPVCSCAFF
jgi:hypothetical protein